MSEPNDQTRTGDAGDSGDADTKQRLYRSRDHRALLGIFGGMGEHLSVDPALLRLVYLGLIFFSGAGLPLILFYFLAALVIPLRPE